MICGCSKKPFAHYNSDWDRSWSLKWRTALRSTLLTTSNMIAIYTKCRTIMHHDMQLFARPLEDYCAWICHWCGQHRYTWAKWVDESDRSTFKDAVGSRNTTMSAAYSSDWNALQAFCRCQSILQNVQNWYFVNGEVNGKSVVTSRPNSNCNV